MPPRPSPMPLVALPSLHSSMTPPRLPLLPFTHHSYLSRPLRWHTFFTLIHQTILLVFPRLTKNFLVCRPFLAILVQAPPWTSSRFLHYHRESPIIQLVSALHRSQTHSSRPPLSELASLPLPLNKGDLCSPLPPQHRPPAFVLPSPALLPLPRLHIVRLRLPRS
jgi:hypothetical protein